MTRTTTLLPVCEPSAQLDNLKAIAGDLGFEILSCGKSDEVLAEIADSKPDMVVLDQSTLALSSDIKDAQVILLTGNNDEKFIAEQLKQGVDEFLFTPIKPALACHQLKQQQQLQQARRQQQHQERQTLKLRELGDLVGLISHEVASPLGNVNTAVSFLLESSQRIRSSFDQQKLAANDLDKFLKQMDKALNMCIKNSANAGGIISSFRSVATNQCLEKIQQFYLHRYIDEIVLSLKSKLKKLPHEIHVVVCEAIDMTSDAGAFSQVINGLINKAIRHAFDDNDPGQIIINARVEPQEGVECVVLDFIDNGKGIASDAMETLLDNNRQGSGSELTTAMLKQIVELQLQGKMQVESSDGKGAHFTITMPQRLG